ncbi:hypothetical protein [Botrimarina sp.]|uniref:hypothetical protein n=1 Tax=Botrimarina sp. TaxID=2795802 RepID=UPI0032EE17B0
MAEDPENKPDDDARSDDKQHVFTEEAKQRQVSHWDMDYLPREEIDKAMEEKEEQSDEEQTTETEKE